MQSVDTCHSLFLFTLANFWKKNKSVYIYCVIVHTAEFSELSLSVIYQSYCYQDFWFFTSLYFVFSLPPVYQGTNRQGIQKTLIIYSRRETPNCGRYNKYITTQNFLLRNLTFTCVSEASKLNSMYADIEQLLLSSLCFHVGKVPIVSFMRRQNAAHMLYDIHYTLWKYCYAVDK